MYSTDILGEAEALVKACRAAGLKVATAESCTGGLIGGALTAVPGSSAVFERGFLTYSNEAKSDVLGIDAGLIEVNGAVSEPVARAMAEGALAHAPVDLTVAVTGIAGPGGGTAEKPVGTVHMAAAARGKTTLHEHHVFPGDRAAVRAATVLAALQLAERQLAS